ncbi:hypothetical protein UA08_01350 [Talaromyces atroroseus]|uniref:F-box domain-containing protein n=1 Tax=Talaromyces atroroseus TaxID=1441469 RepID=A0A1Q5QB17_TALAT|nr:hypothetical protein UA08_01350 [Talaromyces atroroseus]OKL63147.1 hypothetical protein UA08_01350 [Talaromyces atroroseus]
MPPRSRPETNTTSIAGPNSQNTTDSHNGVSTKKRRPGRPLLSFAELAARKAARLSKRKYHDDNVEASSSSLLETAQARRGNASSSLEKLPVELLEKIFLYALETNFCRASPYLAAAVSSQRIYRTLIRLAFFRNDFPGPSSSSNGVVGVLQNESAREKIAEALKPADYDTMRLDDAERVYLQSTILKCRWCTKQCIQDQLPALMQMVIQRHWVGANITISDPVQQASLDELLQLRRGGGAIEDVPPASSVLFRGNAPNGKTYYMSITPLVSVSINCAEASVRDVHRVLNVRVIPDYLLRGRRSGHDRTFSFEDEDIDLLEIFRHEYGFDGTGHDMLFSRPALQAGIKTALDTQNARALTSLLKVDEFFTRRRLETGSAALNASQGVGEYFAIPGEYFLRVVQMPIFEALPFFKLLLRCNAESMPSDSSEITQWAMELSTATPVSELSLSESDDDESDDDNLEYDGTIRRRARQRKTPQEDTAAFGRWLLDFMIELPRYVDEARENPSEKALFYYGAINSHSHEMGRRFLDEVCIGSSRDELTQSWIQKMSFDVSKTWRG